MFRQFWIHLINEGFTGFRLWSSLFDDFANGGASIRGFALASASAGPAPAESSSRGQAASVVPDLIFTPAETDILILAPVALLGPIELPNGGAVALMDAPGQSAILAGVGVQSTIAGAENQFLVLFDEFLSPSLIVDTAKMEILGGGAQDPVLGNGVNDMLLFSGGFSDVDLPVTVPGLDLVLLRSGSSSLASKDGTVAEGDVLTIDAMPLDLGEHVEFDGSAESDGRFVFYGSRGDDLFKGGAGDDRLYGENGADRLTGGGGADIFAYGQADDSTGATYDTLTDFDPSADKLDLLGSVGGFADALEGGSLSVASFDADLGAAIGGDGLGAGQAVLFAPDAGDLAGTLFLIVDANGEIGYQAGEDFVFALPSADLGAVDGNIGIFV